MEDYKGCRQHVYFNVNKQREGVTTITTPSSITQRVDSITINFSCDTRTNLWVPRQDRVVEQRQPLIFNSVRIDRPQILYSDATHEAVKREIKGWNMSDYWREWMIKNVLSNVRDLVKSVPTGCNAMDVLVEVIVVHDHTVQESVHSNASIEDLSKKKKKKDCGKKICRLARHLRISHVFPKFLYGL